MNIKRQFGQKRSTAEVRYSGISKPTEAAIIRAQEELDNVRAEIMDLEAVERAFYIIGYVENGRAIRKAVEIVYCTDLETPLNRRGFIQGKVIEASLAIPAGEATVYRYLKKARYIFAVERGLRL